MTPAFTTAMSTIGGFESHPALAVAVSGGSDSMALLLLAEAWARERGGKVIALTVDHHLRPESTREAAQVKSWCAQRNIEHHTLDWHPILPVPQADAREARYGLLLSWCRAHHVLHLLTGHHQGDQAETLFFRLARGSDMDGLAGIAAVSQSQSIRLLRPLLNFSKASLANYLLQQSQPWIEDPSNQSGKYSRNLIREQLSEPLIEQAHHLSHSFDNIRNQLKNKLASYLTQCASLYPEGYASIARGAFLAAPPELALRMLSGVLTTVSGAAYPPRREDCKRLIELLRSPSPPAARTLAGCMVRHQPSTDYFIVYREPNAIAPDAAISSRWDGRFAIAASPSALPLTVGALGTRGRAIAKAAGCWFSRALPAYVIPTLPAFWHLEELIAAPHIHYTHPLHRDVGCTARFIPPKPLAGAAFFGLNANGNLQ